MRHAACASNSKRTNIHTEETQREKERDLNRHTQKRLPIETLHERWGAGVETQKNGTRPQPPTSPLHMKRDPHQRSMERWGAGVETQKNVQGEIGGWGRVPFNEPYAPSLSTIYDGE